MLILGNGLTIRLIVCVPTQPFAFVPLAVYKVVLLGLAVTFAELVLFNAVFGDHV